MVKKIFPFFKSLFLSGLFSVLPIAFTLFFINFLYHFVYRILEPLRQLEPAYIGRIPGSEFILATVLIVFLGILLKVFVINSVIDRFEKTITRIPLVRIVYSSAKTLVDFFKMPEKTQRSHQVVLIPYPCKRYYNLAFLLETADKGYQKLIPECNNSEKPEKFCKVFMPNSPNPTTGYFFLLPESEIIYTDITFEEAIKTLVSCGLITPESLKKFEHEKGQ